MAETGPTLVFDGDCGFCTSSARFAARHLSPPGLRVVAWQQADLDQLGLTPEQCSESVQWVGAGGHHAAGPDALAALLQANAGPWRWLGRAIELPGLHRAAAAGYRWVSENRHRLPGSTPARPDSPT